jgi:hypothetical protein
MPMPWFSRIHRIEGDQRIEGTTLDAFIHNGDYFHAEIKIYADSKVDCWELVNFAQFKEKVRKGWVVTQLPEGALISISGLASMNATNVRCFVEPEEFIKEVADEILELNHQPTTGDKCRETFKEFTSNPTEELRQRLKEAYEAIPVHCRRYVLHDQDAKDFAIRMAIYGEEEIEKWSHRIAARSAGIEPLPSIYVPGVLPKKSKPWWRFW